MASSERVVVVTGGAKGIGLACARAFAAEGNSVVIADVEDAPGAAAAEELTQAGHKAQFVACDVGERLHIHNLMADTLDSFGRVDVLVNNAGIVAPGDILALDEADFDRVLRVNLKGAFLASQAVARQMVKQIEAEGAGPDTAARYAIVNISSVNAITAVPDQLAFTVSKGALNQLTRVMALALARHGIRVNAIGPGSINADIMRTEMSDVGQRKGVLSRTPLGRIGDPDEVASIALFLASSAASYVTGQCIYADGGRLALNYTVPTKDSAR